MDFEVYLDIIRITSYEDECNNLYAVKIEFNMNYIIIFF